MGDLETESRIGVESVAPAWSLPLTPADTDSEIVPDQLIPLPIPTQTVESVPESTLPKSAPSSAVSAVEPHGYDGLFWLAYLANGLTTMANAMMVRYSDFVEVVGGEERQLGFIVGCGMMGSILMRLGQGVAIDHYGASRVWRWSITFYTFSLFLHLLISTAYGPGIFIARLLLQSSVAGFFGSSITFVSLRVPPQRMAEMIGALGTSGFIGIMLGPLLGDWLASGTATQVEAVQRLFLMAGLFASISLIFTFIVTRDAIPPRRRRRPPLVLVVKRYLPLVLAMTAGAMGAGFTIPMTFLRPFAEESHLNGVGFFFFVYASVAFVARVATRSQFARRGNRMWILIGLILLSVSFLTYLPISQVWHFAIPAAIAGTAHALLFPSVMAAGTSVFPRRYLGIATSLMLAMFDMGAFLGAPLVGVFLREAKRQAYPAYPLMFAGVSLVIGLVTVVFLTSKATGSRIQH